MLFSAVLLLNNLKVSRMPWSSLRCVLMLVSHRGSWARRPGAESRGHGASAAAGLAVAASVGWAT